MEIMVKEGKDLFIAMTENDDKQQHCHYKSSSNNTKNSPIDTGCIILHFVNEIIETVKK